LLAVLPFPGVDLAAFFARSRVENEDLTGKHEQCIAAVRQEVQGFQRVCPEMEVS
jgi:hypothetical protein